MSPTDEAETTLSDSEFQTLEKAVKKAQLLVINSTKDSISVRWLVAAGLSLHQPDMILRWLSGPIYHSVAQ